MRRTFSVLILLFLCGALGCGGGSRNVIVPQPQVTNAFMFLQEVPNQGATFTPMSGQYTVTGSDITFQALPAQDPVTGQVVGADFGSMYLSAAGDKVAFDLWGGMDVVPVDQWDIYVESANGQTITQITNDSYEDAYPQLSADGRKVVFNSQRDLGSGLTEVAIVSSTTTPMTPAVVLPMPLGAQALWDPTFSPDGRKIAVEAIGDNNTNGSFDGILLMNADGSSPRLITNPATACDCWDGFPAFTPDGSQIVFTGYTNSTDGSYLDLYITNLDGSGTTLLTDGVGFNVDPLVIHVPGMAQKIVFESNRDNLTATASAGYDLYSMNLDGSGLLRLTSNGLFDGFSQEWFVPQGTAATAKAAIRARHGHRLPAQAAGRPLHGLKW